MVSARIMQPHSLYGILIMIYDIIAPFYDAVNAHIDYTEWANFIEKVFEKAKPDTNAQEILEFLGY